MLLSIAGTVLTQVALDNISKYFRSGMLKDRFNLENESFEQSTECVSNPYSVNIPMRFYYQGNSVMAGSTSSILSEEPGLWEPLVLVKHSLL